jgi:hypothetical protein
VRRAADGRTFPVYRRWGLSPVNLGGDSPRALGA